MPAVLPFIAAGATLGGGAISAVGAIRQGQAATQAANFNATVARQNAVQARAQAVENERRFRIQSQKRLGAARASFSKAGVQLEGSALDVLAESAANAELDALSIRHAGEVQAIGFQRGAALDIAEGRAARQAGILGATSSLLSAGGQALGQTGFLKRV